MNLTNLNKPKETTDASQIASNIDTTQQQQQQHQQQQGVSEEMTKDVASEPSTTSDCAATGRICDSGADLATEPITSTVTYEAAADIPPEAVRNSFALLQTMAENYCHLQNASVGRIKPNEIRLRKIARSSKFYKKARKIGMDEEIALKFAQSTRKERVAMRKAFCDDRREWKMKRLRQNEGRQLAVYKRALQKQKQKQKKKQAKRQEPQTSVKRQTDHNEAAQSVDKEIKSDEANSTPTSMDEQAKPSDVSNTTSKAVFSPVAASLKMGIFPENLYNSPFSVEQMAAVREAVIDTAIEVSPNGIKPNFTSCFPRSGWLMIVCSNRETSEWLEQHSAHFRHKCNFGLTVLKEEDFPRPRYIHGYFPHSASLANEKILATVEAQNELSTRNWKILERTPAGQTLHLLLIVDDRSYTTLVGMDGKIAYRFGRIKLLLKTFNKHDQPEGGAEATIKVEGGDNDDLASLGVASELGNMTLSSASPLRRRANETPSGPAAKPAPVGNEDNSRNLGPLPVIRLASFSSINLMNTSSAGHDTRPPLVGSKDSSGNVKPSPANPVIQPAKLRLSSPLVQPEKRVSTGDDARTTPVENDRSRNTEPTNRSAVGLTAKSASLRDEVGSGKVEPSSPTAVIDLTKRSPKSATVKRKDGSKKMKLTSPIAVIDLTGGPSKSPTNPVTKSANRIHYGRFKKPIVQWSAASNTPSFPYKEIKKKTPKKGRRNK